MGEALAPYDLRLQAGSTGRLACSQQKEEDEDLADV
jgi:hypothetical protein